MLNWLKKEEEGKKNTDWKKELRKALSENEDTDETAEMNEAKVKRRAVKAPWSYQSFVQAEPRNFQRGKKRQGLGTEIYVIREETS